MDEKTRGFIEKSIDSNLYKILKSSEKPLKDLTDEILVKSFSELWLGFVLGTLDMFCGTILVIDRQKLTRKEQAEIKKMLKRRVPEIAEKISRKLAK